MLRLVSLVQRGPIAWVFAILISVQLASIASAQPDRNRARTLYAAAQSLFNSGNYAAAESSFRAAYAASPNPVVLRAISSAQERQGNIAGAVQTLQQYLRDAGGAADRAEVEAHIRELSSHPGSVAVSSTPPGAEIFLDGRDTGQRTPATLSASSGAHSIELRMTGYGAAPQQVNVAASSTVRLAIPLTPGMVVQPVATGGGSGDPSAEVWITAGIGAAGLISGTIFGFLALSDQSSYDAQPSRELLDRGPIFALVCDISFGVAIVGAATAILLYILERPSGPARTARNNGLQLGLAPWASPTGGGMGAQLRF